MPSRQFAFTKLVVTDLEASEAFYTSVFGLQPVARVNAEIAGRTIDEVMFAATPAGGGSFVLLRYEDATGPAREEVILGMMVDDLATVLADIEAAGGTVVDPAHDLPEHGVKVGFATDPEGHLLEIVELLG